MENVYNFIFIPVLTKSTSQLWVNHVFSALTFHMIRKVSQYRTRINKLKKEKCCTNLGKKKASSTHHALGFLLSLISVVMLNFSQVGAAPFSSHFISSDFIYLCRLFFYHIHFGLFLYISSYRYQKLIKKIIPTSSTEYFPEFYIF